MKINSVKELSFTSNFYLILAKESFPREQAVKLLLEKNEGEPVLLDAAKVLVERVIEDCNSLSFFSTKKVIVVRNIDQWNKEAFTQLETLFSHPPEGVVLIF